MVDEPDNAHNTTPPNNQPDSSNEPAPQSDLSDNSQESKPDSPAPDNTATNTSTSDIILADSNSAQIKIDEGDTSKAEGETDTLDDNADEQTTSDEATEAKQIINETIQTLLIGSSCLILLGACIVLLLRLPLSEVRLGIFVFAVPLGSGILVFCAKQLGINLPDALWKLYHTPGRSVALLPVSVIIFFLPFILIPNSADALNPANTPSAPEESPITFFDIDALVGGFITDLALPLFEIVVDRVMPDTATPTFTPSATLTPTVTFSPTATYTVSPTPHATFTVSPQAPTVIPTKDIQYCFIKALNDGTRLREIPDITHSTTIITTVQAGTWLQAFFKRKSYKGTEYDEWYKVQIPGEDRQGYVHETLVEPLNCEDITYESDYRIVTESLLPVTVLPVQKTVVAQLPEPTYTSEPVQNVISISIPTAVAMTTSSPIPTAKLTDEAASSTFTATLTPTITPSPTPTVGILAEENGGLPTAEVDGSPFLTPPPTGIAEATEEYVAPTVDDLPLTPTSTETATLTPTLTATDTPTLTATDTPTLTPSATPTPSWTPSSTPTLTATAMPTPRLRIEIVPPQTSGSLAYGARVYLETGNTSELITSDMTVVFRLVDMNSVEQHSVQEKFSLYCLWQGDPACLEPSAVKIAELHNQLYTLYIQAYWKGLAATLTDDFFFPLYDD